MASQGQSSSAAPRPPLPESQGTNAAGPQQRADGPSASQSTSVPPPAEDHPQPSKRRRNHRAGRKKKNRRQSFVAGDGQDMETDRVNRNMGEPSSASAARPPFYRLGQSSGRNLSETSLESEALLDHRYVWRVVASQLRGSLTFRKGSSCDATTARKPSIDKRIQQTVQSRSSFNSKPSPSSNKSDTRLVQR